MPQEITQVETPSLEERASRLYNELLSDCPELWEDNDGIDADDIADAIFDAFTDEHPELDDDTTAAVYEHIYAGLT